MWVLWFFYYGGKTLHVFVWFEERIANVNGYALQISLSIWKKREKSFALVWDHSGVAHSMKCYEIAGIIELLWEAQLRLNTSEMHVCSEAQWKKLAAETACSLYETGSGPFHKIPL